MKKCFYCGKEIKREGYENKIGTFCSEDHYDKYYKSLSKEEIIEIMNNMCVCSDD